MKAWEIFLEVVDESSDFRVVHWRFVDDDFHGKILEPVDGKR